MAIPISEDDSSDEKVHKSSRRLFSRFMKEECWKAAQNIPGRDPDRWKFDASGHIVCKALTSCLGPLCHEYDHIIPYSQGGETRVENCQILSTRVNRLKSNKVTNKLQDFGYKYEFSMEELDLVELACYGNIKRYVAQTTQVMCECQTVSMSEFKNACKRPVYERKTPIVKS